MKTTQSRTSIPRRVTWLSGLWYRRYLRSKTASRKRCRAYRVARTTLGVHVMCSFKLDPDCVSRAKRESVRPRGLVVRNYGSAMQSFRRKMKMRKLESTSRKGKLNRKAQSNSSCSCRCSRLKVSRVVGMSNWQGVNKIRSCAPIDPSIGSCAELVDSKSRVEECRSSKSTPVQACPSVSKRRIGISAKPRSSGPFGTILAVGTAQRSVYNLHWELVNAAHNRPRTWIWNVLTIGTELSALNNLDQLRPRTW